MHAVGDGFGELDLHGLADDRPEERLHEPSEPGEF